MTTAQVFVPVHRTALVVLTTQMGLVMVVCSAVTGKQSDPGFWRSHAFRNPSIMAGGVSMEPLAFTHSPNADCFVPISATPSLEPLTADAETAQIKKLAEFTVTRIGSLYGP